MKRISHENLIFLVGKISDVKNWDRDTFERLLDRFGDDWFIEDGVFKKCEENSEMKKLRSMYKC